MPEILIHFGSEGIPAAVARFVANMPRPDATAFDRELALARTRRLDPAYEEAVKLIEQAEALGALFPNLPAASREEFAKALAAKLKQAARRER